MKLRAQNPPHIRSRESNQTMMIDVVVAMLPLYAMAAYFYGARAMLLGVFGAVTASFFELICCLIARKVPNIRDSTPLVTGLLIPLMLPATARFAVVALAVMFAIGVAKQPFGGTGHNIFNPAMAGVAFATVCWPQTMFAYPAPLVRLSLTVEEGVRLVGSPAHTLSLGGVPSIDLLDMLVGKFSGPMGATNILVLCSCLLFLLVRKTASLWMTGSFLAGAAVVAALWPRAMLSAGQSVCYELMSGMMLIGAVFVINDPVTSPKRRLPKIVYGFVSGVVCMMFRHIGRFEESLPFAILIMNAGVWMLDLWGEQFAHLLRRRRIELKTDTEISTTADDDFGAAQE